MVTQFHWWVHAHDSFSQFIVPRGEPPEKTARSVTATFGKWPDCFVHLLGVCGVVSFCCVCCTLIACANTVCNTQKQKQTRPRQLCNMSCTHAREHAEFTCWLYVVFAVHVVWTFCCANKHIDSRDRIGVRRDHKHIHCFTCIVFFCDHKLID